MKGIVRRFYVRKGFGFIEGDLGAEYFFHYSEFAGDKRALQPGLEVEFEPRTGDKGPAAGAVRLFGEPAAPRRPAARAPSRDASAGHAAPRGPANGARRLWVVPFGAGLACGVMMGIGSYALLLE